MPHTPHPYQAHPQVGNCCTVCGRRRSDVMHRVPEETPNVPIIGEDEPTTIEITQAEAIQSTVMNLLDQINNLALQVKVLAQLTAPLVTKEQKIVPEKMITVKTTKSRANDVENSIKVASSIPPDLRTPDLT